MEMLQVRTTGLAIGRMHMQGGGVPMNRKYGLSVEIRVSPEITDWLETIQPTLKSLASGETRYIPAALVDDGKGHRILVEGEELNDPRGMLLEFSDESPNIAALIQFAYENKLIEGGEEE